MRKFIFLIASILIAVTSPQVFTKSDLKDWASKSNNQLEKPNNRMRSA